MCSLFHSTVQVYYIVAQKQSNPRLLKLNLHATLQSNRSNNVKYEQSPDRDALVNVTWYYKFWCILCLEKGESINFLILENALHETYYSNYYYTIKSYLFRLFWSIMLLFLYYFCIFFFLFNVQMWGVWHWESYLNPLFTRAYM